MQLALRAFKNGQFETKKAASLAFDMPETTLRRQIQGIDSVKKGLYRPKAVIYRGINALSMDPRYR